MFACSYEELINSDVAADHPHAAGNLVGARLGWGELHGDFLPCLQQLRLFGQVGYFNVAHATAAILLSVDLEADWFANFDREFARLDVSGLGIDGFDYLFIGG